MLFNSLTFLLFLAVVLPLYYALAHRWQNKMLVVASYVFYGAWDWRFLFLLLISTVVDFNCARAMDAASPKGRKRLLYLSLAVNLGILGFFKYFNFFIGSAASLLDTLGFQASIPTLTIILPVGISFYTFQTLAYTIDVYRGKQKSHRDIIDFALYVSYFPQLVAGPIERSQRLLTQIAKPRTVDAAAVSSGVQLIIMGYLKKVAIADSVAPYVESAFADPSAHSTPFLILSLYLFALQIYGDFSGYSDIARGVSRLLGIELMINFRQPYLARHITEFWRRWHISLSSWLRDYLYIPLGGNRGGNFATYRNLMITMLLGGLWHGASWNFVIWGGLHGVYLSVHKLVAGDRLVTDPGRPKDPVECIRYLLGVFLTFNLVCLTWIFFRADTFGGAWSYLTALVGNGFAVDFALRAPVAAFYLGIALLVDFLCWRRGQELPIAPDRHPLARGLFWGTALVLIFFVGEPNGTPFIYFQF
jgi:D-alanyl-lipoteichoic acid acyltransferase DltB (MBOAT superfamily)